VFFKVKSLSRKNHLRIEKAVHLKDDRPKPEEEEERILAYVLRYNPGAGVVKKKVLHSGNLMIGPTINFFHR
jgi:hypothetical protein